MKQVKKKLLAFCLSFGMILSCMMIPDKTYAASSFENAKVFYDTCESVMKKQPYHSESYNGCFYMATQGKLASSSTSLKYYTLGYDMTLSAGGYSMEIGVKRVSAGDTSGSLVEINKTDSGEYRYVLFRISEESIRALARAKDPVTFAKIESNPYIVINLNAVITTKKGNTLHGSVSEVNGSLVTSGTTYRLKNASELSALKRVFTGHTFSTEYDIRGKLDNNLLQVRYNLNGGTVGNGYSKVDDVLYKGGSPVVDGARIYQTLRLKTASEIGLSRTGYHLEAGKEWVTSNNQPYPSGVELNPKTVCPELGYANKNIYVYANWKPNTYTILFDANGGTGTISPMYAKYDTSLTIRNNTFEKIGHTPKRDAEGNALWNTKADGTGTTYTAQQVTSNLTAENGGTVILYAQWEPIVAKITTDQQGGSGGTPYFYEKYSYGFYSEEDCVNAITGITIPERTGYTFLGYYEYLYGRGDKIVTGVNDETGKVPGMINVNDTRFLAATTIFASYKANQYTITFDKQGGVGGTDSVVATFDEDLPLADGPIKTGWSFKGYYTQPQGKGVQYYNEYMASMLKYRVPNDITLYAYWVDDTAPDVVLNINIPNWTNRELILTATAYDYGVGLDRIELYRNGTLVSESKNLNGAASAQLQYTHTEEGVFIYRAVAVDKNGNAAEFYRNAFYDIKAPTGSVVSNSFDGTNLSIHVKVTDKNVK